MLSAPGFAPVFAENSRAEVPISGLVRDHYLSAMAWGWADIDWAGLAKVSAVEAGLEQAREGPGATIAGGVKAGAGAPSR